MQTVHLDHQSPNHKITVKTTTRPTVGADGPPRSSDTKSQNHSKDYNTVTIRPTVCADSPPRSSFNNSKHYDSSQCGQTVHLYHWSTTLTAANEQHPCPRISPRHLASVQLQRPRHPCNPLWTRVNESSSRITNHNPHPAVSALVSSGVCMTYTKDTTASVGSLVNIDDQLNTCCVQPALPLVKLTNRPDCPLVQLFLPDPGVTDQSVGL